MIDGIFICNHPLSEDEIKKIAEMEIATKSIVVDPIRKLPIQWPRIRFSN